MADAVHPNDGANGSGQIRNDFIPADRYRAPELTRLEKTRLWPKVWQIVCREEEIPETGDYVTYVIADESIIVVRQSETEIKALYNVCQHRGRRLVDTAKGRTNGFFCKFHGWRYQLDGTLANIHQAEAWADYPQFDAAELGLKSLRCERWGGWVWINMDPAAEDLLSYLGDAAALTDAFDFQDLRRAWHFTILAPVNWKVVAEAFNEGYHSGATHSTRLDYYPMLAPAVAHGRHAMYFTQFLTTSIRARQEAGVWKKTENLIDMLYWQSRELFEDLGAMVVQPLMDALERLRAETPPDAPAELVFENLWNFHKEALEKTGAKWPPRLTPEIVAKAGTGWHVFPNTIFLPTADAVLWYRVRPHGNDPDRCVFDIWCLRRYAPGQAPEVRSEFRDSFEAARGMSAFLEQDFDNMRAVNEGMKSRGWRGAVTNPSTEVAIVNFHRVLDDYLDVADL